MKFIEIHCSEIGCVLPTTLHYLVPITICIILISAIIYFTRKMENKPARSLK